MTILYAKNWEFPPVFYTNSFLEKGGKKLLKSDYFSKTCYFIHTLPHAMLKL
uniref:Uncharacterized protein n=1 Tax=Anguilla anguilla TaxID=7936 RepID=A0A0E9WK23_ANGAN